MARPGQARLGAEISLTAVTEAVEAVMRASNRGGVADEAMAARIGALIRPMLTEVLTGRITSGAELLGQAAFRTILSQHLAGSSAQMDEESRRAMREYLLRNANRTGPEFAALAAQYLRGGGWNGRAGAVSIDSDSGGEAPANGARFDGISGADAAFLSSMRSHAVRCGLHWAADNHDILRLGAAAIEALAAVQFRQEMFERSIRNGYHARDVVGLVNYAREARRDPHAVAEGANEAVEVLGGNDASAREGWRGLYRNLGQARGHRKHARLRSGR